MKKEINKKAQYLVNKFKDENYYLHKDCLDNAKYNAKLCVDIIIINLEAYEKCNLISINEIKFYNNVKSEIDNITDFTIE